MTNVHRGVKNSVFLDLFSIPKYSLQLLRTLHPEMTDLTENDMKPVTLNPVIMNGQYNDLALLVRDKLMIFVEAQSTWSINIMVRILMYLSWTYKEYIAEHDLNIYVSKKLIIPEPEFYVIYTGKRKIEKDIFSLREDFWNNTNSKMDLLVKVIHSENKEDIIGQYIIFAHVIDSQMKIHGRTETAIENTIRICQDDEVLKEYLNGRKKEVVDIMRMLFDQEYATGVYGRERERIGERRGRIENTVEMCQEFGKTFDETVNMLVKKFDLSLKEASKRVYKLWKA